MKKNNSGCIIWILIILAIAGVAWVRYLLPLVAVFIIIAVINGVKNKKTNSSQGDERERRNKSTTQTENRTSKAQGKTDGEEPGQSKTSRSGKKKQEGTTIITCDYCGCRVDTSQYNTCPHCGGPYWDNEQWRRKMT